MVVFEKNVAYTEAQANNMWLRNPFVLLTGPYKMQKRRLHRVGTHGLQILEPFVLPTRPQGPSRVTLGWQFETFCRLLTTSMVLKKQKKIERKQKSLKVNKFSFKERGIKILIPPQ